MRRVILILCAVVGIAVAATPSSARAASAPPPDTQVPLYPSDGPKVTPPGFQIDAARALAIAETSPTMRSIHRAHHPLQYQVLVWVRSHYEIYFSFHGKVIADQIVTPAGRLGPTYTGPLIGGIYARQAYGEIFDSPWVFVPFTLMFLLPLVLLRRRTWLDILDLVAVLGFGVSYAVFDTGHLEPGVWLAYPPLLYLLVRMLLRGWRPRSSRGIECRMRTAVLAAGLVLLVAARIALTLQPVAVLDVGTASALGAYKILHGQSLYFYSLGHPDTYGPIAYLAYVPFEAIWPGSWTYLPAARAATISFDLLTIGGLLLIGVRLRHGREGWRLGLLLAWLWAACPFSVLGLVKNTNDGLVSLLVVLMMLSLTAPIRRGVLVGLGAAAKFFPAVLLPLMAVARGDAHRRPRAVVLAFAVTVGASVALFLPPGGLRELYDHTIGYQLAREDIFSIWSLHPGLAPIKVVLELAVGILAVAVAFRPRGPRTNAQVSALAAALIVAVQLPALHWFYLYIVWFLPLVLIAVLGAESLPGTSSPPGQQAVSAASQERDPAWTLVGAG